MYPSLDMRKEMEKKQDKILDDAYDIAIQIEVFEDSSFLLTEEGTIYSWGRNDHGFLGREAKIDVKSLAFNDKRKKLAFSTFTPGKVSKLEKYSIKKIKVVDGKFYAYFIESTSAGEGRKDSEVSSEEEKDVMPSNFLNLPNLDKKEPSTDMLGSSPSQNLINKARRISQGDKHG